MAAFAEALYEANKEPLHLILDEADLWARQRPLPDQTGLLGHIEEIVRRGRVRGFIPWLITQRPAVVHKDVLSQADILIAMKLTASQDREAVGGWIEGQADRQEGKRILGDLPRLQQGEGYLWAPGRGILARAAFPAIRTFDSSRTPKRGERLATPRTLAAVDLTAIVATLAAVEAEHPRDPKTPPRARSDQDRQRQTQLERELAEAMTLIADLEQQNHALAARIAQIAALATDQAMPSGDAPAAKPRANIGIKPARPLQIASPAPAATDAAGAAGDGIHPAAHKLLMTAAQHAPGRFTWGQLATLAGLKPSGGHFNAGRKSLRESGYIVEEKELVTATEHGQKAAGEVPPAPSTPAERLNLWCGRLPSPAPEILRALAAQGGRYLEVHELAAMLGKKPTGGHWNSGIAVLRNNGLIEAGPAHAADEGKRYRVTALFRE